MSHAITLTKEKIFVAGHRGLVGQAICQSLETKGCGAILTAARQDLDLRDDQAVMQFLREQRPSYVVVAAARVGGIHANNSEPANFIVDNLKIQNALIWGAHQAEVPNLVFLGSSCIYPRDTAQPMPEEALLTGPLEQTNRPYAIAKIAGLELTHSIRRQFGRNYFSVMPTNLYGPGDYFHAERSHVIPGLLRRIVEAKQAGDSEVTVWGSGEPRREFLYVDDCADAITHLMEQVGPDSFRGFNDEPEPWSHVNVGSGEEVTIRQLATLIAETVGYSGRLVFDRSRPDGTPRKLLDGRRLRNFGWQAPTSLADGLQRTWQWYQRQVQEPAGLRV